MSEWHPDLETLESFLEDELTEEESRTLQRHLFTCTGCERRLLQILPVPANPVRVSTIPPREELP